MFVGFVEVFVWCVFVKIGSFNYFISDFIFFFDNYCICIIDKYDYF